VTSGIIAAFVWREHAIVLGTGDGSVELAGPIDVLAGSVDRREWRRRRVDDLGRRVRFVRRALRLGDHVLVSGRLQMLPDGETDYRHHRARWRLVPYAPLLEAPERLFAAVEDHATLDARLLGRLACAVVVASLLAYVAGLVVEPLYPGRPPVCFPGFC
jgi:hypothetical protein